MVTPGVAVEQPVSAGLALAAARYCARKTNHNNNET